MMDLDPIGWLREARRIVSPNCDSRPEMDIDLLVIHNISLPPGIFGGDEIIRLFTNTLDPAAHPYFSGLENLRVSAHFLIRRDGELIQFVACDQRAWHAGASCWNGRERCNDFSIGIELEGTDTSGFTPPQYLAAADLGKALLTRYPIKAAMGHSDIAPGRKTDPGPLFDWQRWRDLVGKAVAIPSQ